MEEPTNQAMTEVYELDNNSETNSVGRPASAMSDDFTKTLSLETN